MDQRRMCGPSLTETSLCDTYLYLFPTVGKVWSCRVHLIRDTGQWLTFVTSAMNTFVR